MSMSTIFTHLPHWVKRQRHIYKKGAKSRSKEGVAGARQQPMWNTKTPKLSYSFH